MARKIKLTLELSEEVNNSLEEIAEESGTTKSDVLRKAISLIKVATREKRKGRELGFIDPNTDKVISHIVGI